MDILSLNAELKPFQILGFKADSSIVFSIITTAASFFLVIISLYSSTLANAGSQLL
jgi:hypothetical protein